jgi:excisionase family DNA binding protein
MQLREAADVLGVHYQTAYGWVRQGVLPARKVGRGYVVAPEDVARLAASRARGTEPVRQIRVRDWSGVASRFFVALRDGAETRARAELGRLAGAVSLLDLCEHVIVPALRRIGEQWLAGQLSIAHEHRASAICERLIALHASQPSGRPRGVAVVTTPPGERHSLPALMAAACLREDHWLVHHLAADLPVAEILALSADSRADLIVMSTSTTAAANRARREFEAAQAADWIGATGRGSGPRLLIGVPGQTLRDLVLQARAADEQHEAATGGSPDRGSGADDIQTTSRRTEQ